MGNSKASAATASALYDLQPSYVIMFGIAGGIGDDVALCDVIIPEQIFYCAYGKVSASEDNGSSFQIRPRSAQVDDKLLSRIYDFRSMRTQGNRYAVHTGVFAITERVVASEDAIAELLTVHPKIIGVEMESYGVALATQGQQRDVGFVAIRGISDHADHEKNDKFRETALSNASDFLCHFLEDTELYVEARKDTIKAPKIIAVQHLSRNYRGSIADSIEHLGDEFTSNNYLEVVIDQTDLFEDGSLSDPTEALRRQNEMIAQITEIQKEFPKSNLKYFGLAHVPLIFHLGFKLNRQKIEVFGNYHNGGDWFKLHATGDVPKIDIEYALNEQSSYVSSDIIVMMSMSFLIRKEQLEGLPENPLAHIHIRVDEPDVTIAYSEASVEAFVDAFETIRKYIDRTFPTVERIHLCYAGVPTVAFRCGQLINPNVDPHWIVYNYARHESPSYGWAIYLQSGQVIERRR